jgi:hypothetical protein
MEYEYGFHIGEEEDSGGRIVVDYPIPDILVGHHLVLDNNIAEAKPGINLEILDVEIFIFAPNDKLERVVTEVYTYERDRSLCSILAKGARHPNNLYSK